MTDNVTTSYVYGLVLFDYEFKLSVTRRRSALSTFTSITITTREANDLGKVKN